MPSRMHPLFTLDRSLCDHLPEYLLGRSSRSSSVSRRTVAAVLRDDVPSAVFRNEDELAASIASDRESHESHRHGQSTFSIAFADRQKQIVEEDRRHCPKASDHHAPSRCPTLFRGILSWPDQFHLLPNHSTASLVRASFLLRRVHLNGSIVDGVQSDSLLHLQ